MEKNSFFSFPYNNNDDKSKLDILISSKTAATGTITFANSGSSESFTTTPNQVYRYRLTNPLDAQASDNQVLGQKSIRITADQDISVYGLTMSSSKGSSDGFLVFPKASLGTNYRVASYGKGKPYDSQIVVVATEDGSNVVITPPGGATSVTQTMQAGATFRLAAKSEFTGAVVTADKPIAVFAGSVCTNIPESASACDTIVEQMPPTTALGTSFFASPLETQVSGSRYRVIADHANTEVRINGVLVATLVNPGDFHEVNELSALSIKTSKPTLVMQYANGGNYTTPTSIGDPFMLMVPPSDQYLNDYTIATADSSKVGQEFTQNFVSITAPINPATNQPPEVFLNGTQIAPSQFTPSPQNDFFYSNQSVDPGSYHVQSTVGVGVTVYGFTEVNSYGYTAGLNFSPTALVSEIKISPSEEVTKWVSEQYCTNALVTDAADQPLAGIKVDVSLTGVNPQINSIYTSTTGVAPYCYTSTVAGSDTLTLAAGNKTAVSKVSWLKSNADATLTLTPATTSNPVNTQQCFIATMTDTANQPIPSMAIAFEVAGVNPQNNSASTDSAGQAQLCYSGANAGSDVVSASSGPLKQTASAAWTTAAKSQTLSLSPLTLAAQINTTQCFVASLKDANNAPAANQPVNFVVNGVSSQSSSLKTDSNCNAELCYSSPAAGVDTITVTADSEMKSARAKATQTVIATMTWQTGTVTPPTGSCATPVPVLHPVGLAILAFIMGGFVYTQRRRLPV